MDIHPADDATTTLRQPLVVRCGNGQDPSQGAVVRDWTTINRDVSPQRSLAPRATLPGEEEEPERWDGME